MRKVYKRSLSLILMLAMIFSSFPAAFADSEGSSSEAEQVQETLKEKGSSDFLTKKLSPASDGLLDVELSFTLPRVKRSKAIVLLFDDSSIFNPLKESKEAAKVFLDRVLKDPDAKLAVLPYGESVGQASDFFGEDRIGDLKKQIDETDVGISGSNLQAAIHGAQSLLDKENADEKVIVLLSVGEPRRFYGLTWDPESETADYWGAGNFIQTDTFPGVEYTVIDNLDSKFVDYSKTVEGVASRTHLLKRDAESKKSYYLDFGNMAIAEASYAREKGTRIYPILLSSGMGSEVKDQEMMKKIGDGAYFEADQGTLADQYEQIAKKISPSFTEISLEEQVGDRFVFKSGKPQVLDGKGEVIDCYTLSPDSLKENEKKFTLSFKDELLQKEMPIKVKYRADWQAGTSDGKYRAGQVILKYRDLNGAEKTIAVDGPEIEKSGGGNSGGNDSGGSSGGGSGSGSSDSGGSSGGNDGGSTGGSGSSNAGADDTTIIEDELTPLGKLNNVDHFAYINGFPDGSIRPHSFLTREEVAAVFFRILYRDYREQIRSEASEFTDVTSKRWSAKHIATLTKGKILSGYGDGKFKPTKRITRAELATIASKFDRLDINLEHGFSDLKGHWAEPYVASAVKKGWIKGYGDGTFKPDEYVTRADFINVVNNVLNRHVKPEDILGDAVDFIDLQDSTVWYYCPIKAATNSYLYQEFQDPEQPLLKFQRWTELIHPDIEM